MIKLSNAEVEIEDLKARDESLNKEIARKDEMIKMLQCQLHLNEEINQENKTSDLDDMSTLQVNHEELKKQWEQENEERLQSLQDSLVNWFVFVFVKKKYKYILLIAGCKRWWAAAFAEAIWSGEISSGNHDA